MEISRERLMLGAGTVLAGMARDERGPPASPSTGAGVANYKTDLTRSEFESELRKNPLKKNWRCVLRGGVASFVADEILKRESNRPARGRVPGARSAQEPLSTRLGIIQVTGQAGERA